MKVVKFSPCDVKTRKESTLFRKAWNLWGARAQLDMVVEECAELIKAVQKIKRGPSAHIDSSKRIELESQLADEVVDVQIMCEQLLVMFPTLQYLIPKIRASKLNRLESLVAEAEEKNK